MPVDSQHVSHYTGTVLICYSLRTLISAEISSGKDTLCTGLCNNKFLSGLI